MITTDDLVASRDENNPGGAVEWKTVEELFQRTAGVITLTVNGQEIRTTSEHPFYHAEKGWLPAGDLVSGDRLVGQYGEVVIVNKVEAGGEYEAVYNLRVADWHTYFVGDDGWGFGVWAHNACSQEQIAEYAKKYAELAKANGGKFYKAWRQVAPGQKLTNSNKHAIREFIRTNPDSFPGISIKTRNSGGASGDAATRAQLDSIAQRLESRAGWRLTNGPRSGNPEQWISGKVAGSRSGGVSVDLTAVRIVNRTPKVLRIQTIDTLADGKTPTIQEAQNASRIRKAFPRDRLILIPKSRN